jgi:RimJ/RimL family protein N-acetyltransferase
VSVPDLVGKQVVLVPMRADDLDLLHRWLGEPTNAPYWYGPAPDRARLAERWPRPTFDDAYPQRGRAFRIEAGGKPLGAAIHGPVFGQPRNVLLELVLAPGEGPDIGEDAIRSLAQYVFTALLVRKAWAEVHPEDSRTLAAYRAAGFQEQGHRTAQGQVVLHLERPSPRKAKR